MKRFIVALCCLTIGSLTYVYEEIEAVKIGYTIRKQEESKTLLVDRARALKYNTARLLAPVNLEKKLLSQHIVLESPKSWQTLRVPGFGKQQGVDFFRPPVQHTPLFAKFFVGTAQAQAKEAASA